MNFKLTDDPATNRYKLTDSKSDHSAISKIGLSIKCLSCHWLLARNNYLGDRMVTCQHGHFNVSYLVRWLNIELLSDPPIEIAQIAAQCDDYQPHAA